MCGIVGLFLKNPALREGLGARFATMLAGMADRGPDSAGLAVFHDPVPDSECKLTLFAPDPNHDWESLGSAVAAAFSSTPRIDVRSNHAVLRVAGPAGRVVDDPVSTIDLPATFLDWAGAAGLDARHSTSLRPLFEGAGENGGRNGAGRDYAYNEWELHPNRAGVQLSLRCVRTKTHKLTYEALSDTGELYDLANDPQEMDNRWNDPGVAGVQSELMDMIRARPDDMIPALNEPDGAA